MQLIDNNCVLYPRKLEFHWVELPDLQSGNIRNKTVSKNNSIETTVPKDAQTVAVPTNGSVVEKAETVKRDVPNNESEGIVMNGNDTIIVEESNATIVTGKQ